MEKIQGQIPFVVSVKVLNVSLLTSQKKLGRGWTLESRTSSLVKLKVRTFVPVFEL